MVAPVALLALLAIPLIARGLDVLVLGEAEPSTPASMSSA